MCAICSSANSQTLWRRCRYTSALWRNTACWRRRNDACTCACWRLWFACRILRSRSWSLCSLLRFTWNSLRPARRVCCAVWCCFRRFCCWVGSSDWYSLHYSAGYHHNTVTYHYIVDISCFKMNLASDRIHGVGTGPAAHLLFVPVAVCIARSSIVTKWNLVTAVTLVVFGKCEIFWTVVVALLWAMWTRLILVCVV